MRNLFITVEDEKVQTTEEVEEDRNTEAHTPAALEQSQSEQDKNENS